jgi:hypothetical protein
LRKTYSHPPLFPPPHTCASALPLPLPPGVYTLHDLRVFGRKQGWCPYFLARHMMAFSNVVVYNYQYMIDPKVSQMVGRHGYASSRSYDYVRIV